MTIHDINYLKENSELKFIKCHMGISDKNLPEVFQNVYCIHILSIYTESSISQPKVLSLQCNDIEMDSILIHSAGHITNVNDINYENNVHPLAKVSEIKFTLLDLSSGNLLSLSDYTIYITFVLRYYNPTTQFNNKYLELNPQYNPNVTYDFSESDPDSD